ncbi:hypothetical protein PN36_30480 [Candidatus Thiomargarita nelsonii]|uniref:Uncharacterized protein n=1 Tax=Candidatus Thiomargarita nelsonii TaxID=1003181 RepID=A0A4E0QP87_9GAMM|nr:hypothetical protein PN36_30480 [Candidatus Thiomargarita nelsonii]
MLLVFVGNRLKIFEKFLIESIIILKFMSSLIKKGLITLLKTVKLADPTSISEVAEAAEKYIDGSSFEIEKAYQTSYSLALKAILAGLGEVSILEANTFKEFASKIKPHYLEPFAAAQKLEINSIARQLIAQGEKLTLSLEFNQEKSQEKEQALAQMLSDDKYLSNFSLFSFWRLIRQSHYFIFRRRITE